MAYACGAMDRAPDGGVEWREYMEPFINGLGVGYLNPCDKPINVGVENTDCRKVRELQKQNGQYRQMTEDMKIIRAIDLRMVDISHFLIVNINLDHYACGTWEEIVTANRQKKPILVHITQGKKHCPDWLLGMLGPNGHDMVFNTWEAMQDYLDIIAFGSEGEVAKLNTHNRWVFFDFHKIFNEKVAGFGVSVRG